MYFNTFASGTEPVDMTQTEEFASLKASAADLGIKHAPSVRYRARNFVANGQRFHALEWGDQDAPLLLLLHGGNQTAHSWDLVSLNLADRFHIVAVDQRGHGDSEWPRDGDMSSAAMSSDIAAIIELLNPPAKPKIMAHSMGGNATLRLLCQQAVAERAVIVDTGPETGSEGRDRIQGFVQNAQEWDSVDHYVERVTAYDPVRPREHIMRTMRYNIMQRPDGKLVSKHFPRDRRIAAPADSAGSRRITYEDVARIECPILITRGADSGVLLAEYAERFVKALPNGKLVTVANCGHNVHSQNTPGFLAEVRPFLGVD